MDQTAGTTGPKIDKVLAANLQRAKTAQADKPYFYALVLKGGGTSGKLLVDRLKIKEQPILNAKKAIGGSDVVVGACYWDRQLGKLVFETAKPPLPTWAQLVKTLAKNEAGLSIEPKFIPARSATPPKPALSPGSPAALRPAQKQGEDNSLPGMDRRLQRLLPAYRAAKAGPNPGPALKLWESADRFRSIGDFAKGMKELDEFEKLIALGAPTAKATPPATPSRPDTSSSSEMGWRQALAETEPAYLQGLRAQPAEASKLRAVLAFAKGKAENGDFSGALAALKGLRDLLARAPGPANASAARTPGVGLKQPSLVQLQQSRLNWQSTLQKVRAERDKLVSAIRQDPELASEKALADKAAKLISAKLDEFSDELLKELDKALNAQTPEGRDKEIRGARETIKLYLGKLKDLADIDTNPFVPVKVHDTLSTALNDLVSKML